MKLRAFAAIATIATSLAGSACGSTGQGAAAIYRNNGCAACHGLDREGTAAGPALNTSLGDVVVLRTGAERTVDEGYLRVAMTNPSNDITAGWSDTMPPTDLSDGEIDTLVAWLIEADASGTP